MNRRFVGASLVVIVLSGLLIASDLSDIWDGVCAALCPWSTLCVPPLCDPGTGGGSNGS